MTQTSTDIKVRVAAAQAVGTTGDGWMTKSAQDMVRIAAFAGFDTKALVRRVATSTIGNRGRLINARSVVRVMEEMTDEWDAEQRALEAEMARRLAERDAEIAAHD